MNLLFVMIYNRLSKSNIANHILAGGVVSIYRSYQHTQFLMTIGDNGSCTPKTILIVTIQIQFNLLQTLENNINDVSRIAARTRARVCVCNGYKTNWMILPIELFRE